MLFLFLHSLDDEVWELRLHFQGRDNMERKFSLSEMNYLLLLALIELEGYGLDAYLSYVKDEGKGLEGIEVLDSDEKVEEMLDLFAEKKILNITVREASDPNLADANMDHTLLEEQIPMSQVGDPIVYSVSQEGVLFPVSNSSQPPLVPVDPYFNTQQSCNFNKGKEAVEIEGIEAEDQDEDELDKSSSDFEFFRGDYRGKKISYKSWARGEDEGGEGTSQHYREEEEMAEHYFGAASEPSEFWQEPNGSEEDDEEEASDHVKTVAQKIPVRKQGPTSRSHSEPDHIKFEDFVPEADEFCFPGDEGISDEEDDAPRLPCGRKRKLKKKKERIWYDSSRPDAHEQFRIHLCFLNVVEFREALRNYHVRTLRNFEYHRNDPSRIIAWCSDRKHGCEFYITASKIAHESTFSIKKMNLDHTCGASGENTKVTMKWVAKAVEDTVRSNPGAGVETILSYTKKKFGVHVPKSLAYRARRKAVDVVQGDHKTQYYRLRDYLQCVLDTNPGSRCVVTTKEFELHPAPTPRFHYMFYCLFACKEGFLNGCRPFIGKSSLYSA